MPADIHIECHSYKKSNEYIFLWKEVFVWVKVRVSITCRTKSNAGLLKITCIITWHTVNIQRLCLLIVSAYSFLTTVKEVSLASWEQWTWTTFVFYWWNVVSDLVSMKLSNCILLEMIHPIINSVMPDGKLDFAALWFPARLQTYNRSECTSHNFEIEEIWLDVGS